MIRKIKRKLLEDIAEDHILSMIRENYKSVNPIENSMIIKSGMEMMETLLKKLEVEIE